jgi:hypothetical protein
MVVPGPAGLSWPAMPATTCPRWPLAFLILVVSACAESRPAVRPPSLQAPRPKDDFDGRYLAFRLRQEGCAPDQAATCCPDLRRRLDEAQQRGDRARAAGVLQALATACPELRNPALRSAAAQAIPDPRSAPPLRLRWAAQLDPGDRIYWAGAFLDGRYLPGGDVPPGAHVLEVEMHVASTGPTEPTIYRLQERKEVSVAAGASRTYLANLQKHPEAPQDQRFVLTIEEAPFLPPSSQRLAEQMKTRSTPPPTLVRGKRESYRVPRLPRELSGHNRWRTLLMVCVDEQGKPGSVLPMNPVPHPRLLGVVLESFLQARFAPTTFESEAISTCHPVTFTVSEG